MAYELLDDAPAGRYEVLPAEPADTKGDAVTRLRNAARLLPIVGPMMVGLAGEGPERQIGKGVVRGVGDVGDTLLNAGSKGAAALLPRAGGPEITRWNADRSAGLRAFDAENDSAAYTAGRLGGNIAATAPVGPLLGAGARALGTVPSLTRAAPALKAVGDSLATGGFRTGLAPTGLLGRAGNVATRMAGGGLTGGASAALIDPDSAGTGAAIGAALPPSLAIASKVGDLAASGVRGLLMPARSSSAGKIAEVAGLNTPEQLAAARAALTQQGPGLLAEPLTAPQILQNPGISQLQRTLRNSGETALLQREQAQEVARRAALDRVSPVTGTVQQSAENFGNALAPEVRAGDEVARARVQRQFDSVDPFDESRFVLPIGRMEDARATFLGPGTFGAGNRAQTAIDTARGIGEVTIDAVAPARAGAARTEETLAQAVRRAGGINSATPSGQQLAGELHDLRQSAGMRGIVVNGRGESVDRLAQRMHQAGHIPDDDPATLLNHLRDPDLARGHGHGADQDRIYQAMREASQGDAPGALTVARPVPFREVQNLRSSIGEAHAEAQAKGRTREAAALDRMRRDIDAQVDEVAAGRGASDESFAPDMVQRWRDALAGHQTRMQTFRTGPQASIFRQGGDGLAAAQGAELAPKFFSPRLSQSDDMAAFQRVASPETTGLLKNYAVTDLANQSDALGNMSQAKVGNWVDSRSGAIGGLFDEPERATLNAVRGQLDTSAANTRLGMATGSNTAQNVQSALSSGLLDHPMVDLVGNRIPIVKNFSGPLLRSMRESAKKGRVDELSGLLADPEALEKALADYLSRSVRSPGLLEANPGLASLMYRAAPQLGTSR